MYHSGVLQSSSIGVGILCLVFGMAGVPETKAQQNLPSWANPSPSQDRYQSEPSRRPRPDRSDPSREGTSPTDRPSQGGGGFRTKRNVDECNQCPENKPVCCSRNGNLQCVQTTDKCRNTGGGGGGTVVPIGGPWAPFWTSLMVVMAVGLGVYYLNKEGRPFPGPDGAAAATGSRTFAFAGLIVLGAAAASAYGFEMSAVCGSVLSPLVPWGSYWGGLLLGVGVLVGGQSRENHAG